LTDVETVIGAPVYLLTPEVRDKFELEHVPVMIEQSGNKFQVNEFNVAGFTDAKKWGGEHP
jgi:conjugal transfer pilus assembly protein TraW